MIRRLARFIMPLLVAVLLLVLLPCVAEVWLRWQEFRAGRPLLSSDPRAELLAPSWLTHHQIKPLRSITGTNPDSGETFETQTNSYGLRGAEPTLLKPVGVLRVLVLGDETIFGLDVADQETFTSRLEKLLQTALRRPVEVINGAVPGDCPLVAALRFKHDLMSLNPDLVICHFDMSDVAEDYSYRRSTVLGQGDEPLACPHPLLEKPADGVVQQLGDHFLLAKWGQRQFSHFWRQNRPDEPTNDIDHPLGKFAWLADKPPANWTPHIQQALASLGELSRFTSASSTRLLIITCPAPWQVSATASSGEGVREAAGVPSELFCRSTLPFQLLAQAVNARHLSLCDVSDEFRRQVNPDQLFFNNAPRLSEVGHELYATLVAKFLTTNTLETPPPTANGSDPRSSGVR